jgi:hypothetical protein
MNNFVIIWKSTRGGHVNILSKNVDLHHFSGIAFGNSIEF